MGRIKSKLVKRTAENLLKEENKFSSNFKENNNLIKNLGTSKKIRNKIAGYLTRIKRETKNPI